MPGSQLDGTREGNEKRLMKQNYIQGTIPCIETSCKVSIQMFKVFSTVHTSLSSNKITCATQMLSFLVLFFSWVSDTVVWDSPWEWHGFCIRCLNLIFDSLLLLTIVNPHFHHRNSAAIFLAISLYPTAWKMKYGKWKTENEIRKMKHGVIKATSLLSNSHHSPENFLDWKLLLASRNQMSGECQYEEGCYLRKRDRGMVTTRGE